MRLETEDFDRFIARDMAPISDLIGNPAAHSNTRSPETYRRGRPLGKRASSSSAARRLLHSILSRHRRGRAGCADQRDTGRLVQWHRVSGCPSRPRSELAVRSSRMRDYATGDIERDTTET